MASEQAEEWAKTMREKMLSLIKYETWKLITINDITPEHQLLRRK